MALIGPPSVAAGILRYDWIDPNGVLRDLTFQTSPGLFVSAGATGLGAVEPELELDKIPSHRGSLLRHIRTPERKIELPITINEDSIGDLLDVVDDLRGWFRTGDERSGGTPGTLRVTRPDGTVRQIRCYYNGGLGGDLSQGNPRQMTYVVSLVAPDPDPTASADTVLTYDSGDYGALVEQIVINGGEIDAYPVWTIDGPASNVILNRRVGGVVVDTINLTSNGGLTLTAGQWALITTSPPPRSTFVVLKSTGATESSRLTPTSKLWWLAPGENRFSIQISGATGATLVTLTYRERFLGLVR